MAHITVIADPETCLAFSLAGFSTVPVQGADEAARAFEKASSDSDTGLVLITQRIAQEIRDRIDQVIYVTKHPLVIEIPDTKGPVQKRASVSEMMVSLMRS